MQLAHISHVIELPLNGDNEEWGLREESLFYPWLLRFLTGSVGRLHKANAEKWKQMGGVII